MRWWKNKNKSFLFRKIYFRDLSFALILLESSGSFVWFLYASARKLSWFEPDAIYTSSQPSVLRVTIVSVSGTEPVIIVLPSSCISISLSTGFVLPGSYRFLAASLISLIILWLWDHTGTVIQRGDHDGVTGVSLVSVKTFCHTTPIRASPTIPIAHLRAVATNCCIFFSDVHSSSLHSQWWGDVQEELSEQHYLRHPR